MFKISITMNIDSVRRVLMNKNKVTLPSDYLNFRPNEYERVNAKKEKYYANLMSQFYKSDD